MNKLTIIGNLTADPELRTTPSGVNVCTFTVAVNRRFSSNKEERQTDFFRVTAWRQLGENCSRFLMKGRKVCVVGEVTSRAFTAKDGTPRASLEVTADDVEFLSPRDQQDAPAHTGYSSQAPAPSFSERNRQDWGRETPRDGGANAGGIADGFTNIDGNDSDLPF